MDGERVLSSTVGGAETLKAPPASFVGEVFGDPAWEKYALNADAGLQVRFRANAGPRVVGVAFLSRQVEPEDGLQPPGRGGGRLEERDEMLEGNPSIDSVAIDGPYTVQGPGDTASRRTILTCRPSAASATEEEACARKILSPTRAPRLSPAGDRSRTRDAARVLHGRPARRAASTPASSSALERLLVGSELPVPRRARSGERRPGHVVSHQRPRAGVAAVVFPLEQHSGR